jgi:REP element-mobilizing transposase RayT
MKKSKQLEFRKTNGWGGRRKGAGRKNLSGTVAHAPREKIDFKNPLLITMKLRPGLSGLRTKHLYDRFTAALLKAKAKGLRVLHFSIQGNHVHLLVECVDNLALGAGMNSFGTSFAKAVRKKMGGKGKVFDGRYHLGVLRNPTQFKNTLAYVLLNQAKHEKLIPYNDRFSSSEWFNEWRTLLGQNTGPILEDWRPNRSPLPAYLSTPKSWLASKGWRMKAEKRRLVSLALNRR